jgi:hypothetical protein
MHLHGAHSAVPSRQSDRLGTADPARYVKQTFGAALAHPTTASISQRIPAADGTSTGRPALPRQHQLEESDMGRGLLLWLIGIPLPIILIVWLLGGLHG